MDIGEAGERLTHQLGAESVGRGHGHVVGTTSVAERFVEGPVLGESHLTRVRTYIIKYDDMVARAVGTALVGGERLLGLVERCPGVGLC